ncbi:MAG: HAMP domain-containing histidine kinase [Melioribacter sp.]|nr:HAMP domain-containing histidine kinase [Melioribacter sp.]
MKKQRSILFLIFAFIFAQFAWMGLLGLWIYWYVSNYIIFEKVGGQLSTQVAIESPNVFIFVGGIILIVGIAVAIFLFFRNLTVQIQLTKLYDNFIANVTHELKSPLSSLQLYLETLYNKEISAEKRKEFIETMIKDSNRLNKLINSILEISRLEQKRIAHNFHIYEAGKVFPELMENSFAQFRIPKSSVRFENNANCKCVIDRDAMQIVFDNLTDNAIKYSTGEVKVFIRLSSKLKKMVIEFSDEGIGIDPTNLKKIFHKFQRIDNRSVPNVKGTGLGLYWVKEIVKFHGGKVTAYSEGKDKGTVFRIELPIYKTSKRIYINSLLRNTAKKEKEMEKTDGD